MERVEREGCTIALECAWANRVKCQSSFTNIATTFNSFGNIGRAPIIQTKEVYAL